MKAAVLFVLALETLRVSAFIASSRNSARQLLYSKNAHDHVKISKLQHVQEHQCRESGRETIRCFFSGGVKKGPPANYDAIASQAIAAVQAGLKAGERAMEIEFPPLTSLNKMNDGSAKNNQLAQANNIAVTKKLIAGMGWGKKVYVVCCDPGTKAALGKAPSGADVRLMDAKNLPPAKVGDVQVVITPPPLTDTEERLVIYGHSCTNNPPSPRGRMVNSLTGSACKPRADQGQWVLARKMSETAAVVIVNGVFVNGFLPFEPVYYFKNISGWGSVVRQYPGKFTAYLAGSNQVVPCEAGLVTQGQIRRPDLRSAANALSAAFKAQAGKEYL